MGKPIQKLALSHGRLVPKMPTPLSKLAELLAKYRREGKFKK